MYVLTKNLKNKKIEQKVGHKKNGLFLVKQMLFININY